VCAHENPLRLYNIKILIENSHSEVEAGVSKHVEWFIGEKLARCTIPLAPIVIVLSAT
jgi:hypothetical protein